MNTGKFLRIGSITLLNVSTTFQLKVLTLKYWAVGGSEVTTQPIIFRTEIKMCFRQAETLCFLDDVNMR